MTYKFKIGDWVKVSGGVLAEYDGFNNRLVSAYDFPFPQPVIGQVVGGTFMCEGTVESYFEDYGGPLGLDGGGTVTEFKASKRVFVYLIREGFLNRELRALPEQVEKCEAPKHGLPRMLTGFHWDDEAREQMREIAKDAPRDSKGRFIKVKR